MQKKIFRFALVLSLLLPTVELDATLKQFANIAAELKMWSEDCSVRKILRAGTLIGTIGGAWFIIVRSKKTISQQQDNTPQNKTVPVEIEDRFKSLEDQLKNLHMLQEKRTASVGGEDHFTLLENRLKVLEDRLKQQEKISSELEDYLRTLYNCKAEKPAIFKRFEEQDKKNEQWNLECNHS